MKKKFKILVVEDELIIAESICIALNEFGYTVHEPVINYTEALESIKANLPDLVLIDIHLSGSKDGIELAQEINSMYKIPFVYLTSNSSSDVVNRAKFTNPAAYLLKPISKNNLYITLEIAFHNFEQKITNKSNSETIDYIMVKHNKSYLKILFEDITYFNSQHVYIELNTVEKKKYLIRSSLENYMNKLPHFFIRVHRSYVINTNYLSEIRDDEVVVNDVTVPISKLYYKSLLKIIS